MLANGQAVLVNACAYRSPKITEEPDNQRLIDQLPSVQFTRRWFTEAVLPAVRDGQRLLVVKRGRLWKLPPAVQASSGVLMDPAPVSPQLSRVVLDAVQQFLLNSEWAH
jgi:hypothetical protein